MKIAFVGSRNFPDLELVKRYVKKCIAEYGELFILVSGGARGVDKTAEDEAVRLNAKTKVFPADWENLGKRAGFLRNGQIIENSDKVYAFWDGKSNGTKDSINKAKKSGKEVLIIDPDGTERKG